MITDYLLPLVVFSTIFERFNVFLPQLGFSLKLSLVLLPIVGLVLLLKRRLTFNPTFLFPFFVFLLLAEGLSIITSFDPAQSFQVLVFHTLMIGLFYLIVWSTKEEHNLDRLVWAWGIGAAVVSLAGIWQFASYFWGGDPTLFFESWFPTAKTLPPDTFTQTFYGLASWEILSRLGLTEAILRPSSTFIDVSTGASFVGIFLVLGLGWFLSFRPSDLRRVLMGALMVFSSLYFLMAASRSAALGLAAGLGVFSYLILRDRVDGRKLKRWIIASVAIVFFAVVLFTVGNQERLGSALKRADYARAAAEMLGRSPLLGIGAGNFEPFCTSVLRPGEDNCYSHSIFLTWIGELGVIGLIANLALIVTIALFLWRIMEKLRYFRASEERRFLSEAKGSYNSLWYVRVSGLLGAFVALVFANIFHAHYGLDFTWVLLGIAVSTYYLTKTMNYERQTQELDVLGVRVDNVTMEEALEKVKGFFKQGKKAYAVTPNPEMIMAAQKDREFAKILNQADLAVPDGIGLVWASRVWGTPLAERVSGTDLFLELCAEAARRGGKAFLLGGASGVAEKAARALKKKYPKLKIAGTFAGDGTPAGDGETIAAISEAARRLGNSAARGKSKPSNLVTQEPSNQIDLLFVAYGHGKQERWIKRNLEKVPVKIAIGVGGAFDYVGGDVARAPELLRRSGFEWLYRLIKQPWRFRRQLALIPFTLLVFRRVFRTPEASF